MLLRNDDEAAPGVFPYRRGAYATMYAARLLDGPPVRRLQQRRGVERLLQKRGERGPAGFVGSVRFTFS